jgi:hypothetical protein
VAAAAAAEAAVAVAGAVEVAGGRSRAGKSLPQIPISNSKSQGAASALGFFLAERARLSGCVYRLDI